MSRSHGYRCFLEPDAWTGDRAELDADESTHLARVLRAEIGDEVTLFDGCGTDAPARIVAMDGKLAILEIGDRQEAPPPATTLELVQGLPRRATMDLIVQKATELGVARIAPLLVERTVSRIPVSQRLERSKRWRRIAIESAKQCGNARVPEILPVATLNEWAGQPPGDRRIVLASLAANAPPLANVLENIKEAAPPAVALIIGPEGDFSADEMEQFRSVGAMECSYGDQVLRSDTAALYGLSILHHTLSEG